MTAIRYSARAGAALLMLGLWAGGSQAIASADDGSADQTASTHVGRGSAQHPAPNAGTRARNGAPASAAVTARARSAAPASATAVSRAVSLHRNASAAQPSAPVASTVASTTASTVAAAAGDDPLPIPSGATIAVTNWFSSSWNWLNGLNDPLAQALQGALVEVQRRFFSPTASVRPVQYTSWTPGDPILGALQYIQPGGAEVGIQLTEAPSTGTVQLLSDGTYTYTPGADFTGTDSFTAQVTSGGFNILEPFTPRSTSVTVNINPSPPVQLTRGFLFINPNKKPVVVWDIIPQPGFESSIDAVNGAIVLPGEIYHVELTRWSAYWYDTVFRFEGCSNESCFSPDGTYSLGDGDWWVTLHMYGLRDSGTECSNDPGFDSCTTTPTTVTFNEPVCTFSGWCPTDLPASAASTTASGGNATASARKFPAAKTESQQ